MKCPQCGSHAFQVVSGASFPSIAECGLCGFREVSEASFPIPETYCRFDDGKDCVVVLRDAADALIEVAAVLKEALGIASQEALRIAKGRDVRVISKPASRMREAKKLAEAIQRVGGRVVILSETKNEIKAAEPGATDNPDDAQRLREDH